MANRRIGAALVVGMALLALPASASAARVYAVTADNLYVRNAPGAFVIGTAFKGQVIDVQATAERRRWAYGRIRPAFAAARGVFGAWRGSPCGWVLFNRSNVARSRFRSRNTCRSPRRLSERALFARDSYLARAGTGSVLAVQRKPCADPTVYGNYSPDTGAFSSPYGRAPANRGPDVPGYGQRYVTRDGRAVMLKDSASPTGAPPWQFMKADCVDRISSYIGQIVTANGSVFPFPNRLRRPSELDSFRSDYVFNRLRWRSWGGTSARARGRLRVLFCKPTCADGRVIRRPAGVVLDRRRSGICEGRPVAFYTRLKVSHRRLVLRYGGGFNETVSSRTYDLSPGCDRRTKQQVLAAPDG